MPTSFRALKDRFYRKYFVAQIISMSGSWMQGVAQSWLMYRLTHSGWWLGVIVFCNHFPAFLVGPLAGVLADHTDRRKILTVVETIQMLQAIVLGALVWSGHVQPWHIAVLATMLGISEGFDSTARHSFVPELVSKENLSSAIALNAVIMNISRILGPTSAGVLIGAVGETWCFFLNALSFVPMIWLLARMPLPRKVAVTHRSALLDSIKSGWKYILSEPVMFRLNVISAFVCIVMSMYIALLPIFAKTILGGTASTLGWLTSALGCGAIGGALLFGRSEDVHHQISAVKKSVFFYGVSIMVFGLSKTLSLSMCAMFFIGFNQMGVFPRLNFSLQSLVPEHMRGRVMSVYTMTFMGTVPIGGLISGWCADRVGASTVTAVAGLTGVAGGLLLYWMDDFQKAKGSQKGSNDAQQAS